MLLRSVTRQMILLYPSVTRREPSSMAAMPQGWHMMSMALTWEADRGAAA